MMGISFRIGDVIFDDEAWEKYDDVSLCIHKVELPDAPLFVGEQETDPNVRANVAHFSYSRFAMFIEDNNLQWLKEAIGSHPDIVKIKPDLVERLRSALDRRRASHPDKVAGFAVSTPGPPGEQRLWTDDEIDQMVANSNTDDDMAYLEWFWWWTAWALETCTHPAIQNT